MIHVARLGVGMERGSMVWSTALIGILAAGMLVTVAGMLAVIGNRACDADFTAAGCDGLVPAFAPWEQTAQLLTGLLWVIPTGLGALLGVGITAGEIERGSAQVSWALTRSRLRWLALRAAPVAVVLVIVLAGAAGAAELVSRGRLMTDDAGFHDYQLRSLLVPARGLLAFTTGLAVGALVGRSLPALLVAVIFSAALTGGLLVLVDVWHVASAAFVAFDDPSLGNGSYPLVAIGSGVAGVTGDGILVIPATEYWVWVARESGLLMLAAAAALLLAIHIVQRRSP